MKFAFKPLRTDAPNDVDIDVQQDAFEEYRMGVVDESGSTEILRRRLYRLFD